MRSHMLYVVNQRKIERKSTFDWNYKRRRSNFVIETKIP